MTGRPSLFLQHCRLFVYNPLYSYGTNKNGQSQGEDQAPYDHMLLKVPWQMLGSAPQMLAPQAPCISTVFSPTP